LSPHQKSGSAEDRIEKKPVGFISRAGPFSLKQVVNQSSRISDVPAEISDPGPDRLNDDESIASGGGLDHASHESAVEGPNDTIERFDWVWNGFRKNNSFRGGAGVVWMRQLN
jgi:hypothetical protein